MQDFFGQTLALGDVVGFIPPGYREIAQGRIVAFTPKQVRIAYTNTWNFHSPGRDYETLRYPNVIIKGPQGTQNLVDEQSA